MDIGFYPENLGMGKSDRNSILPHHSRKSFLLKMLVELVIVATILVVVFTYTEDRPDVIVVVKNVEETKSGVEMKQYF
jgi:hypothetical protein